MHQGPAPRPENFLARPYERHYRSKSKREKDMDRLEFPLERQRLFKEAFHDLLRSRPSPEVGSQGAAAEGRLGARSWPIGETVYFSDIRELASFKDPRKWLVLPREDAWRSFPTLMRVLKAPPLSRKAPPLWSWSERSGDELGLHRVAQGSQTGPPLQDMVGVLARELARRSSWSERIVSRLSRSRVYYTLIFSCPRTPAP
jgi:hypothetical protein